MTKCNWAGARWWKFDLHAHTPESICYGRGPNQDSLKNRSAKQWLLDYMKAEVDCVAITDHNSGEWIDLLKAAYAELESDCPETFRDLYLFPGVEITVQGNVHVLGIFSPDKTSTHINSVVDRCEYRGDRGNSNDCTNKSPANVIEEIVRSGGIAIPAHADKIRGIFYEFTNSTLKQILESPNIYAVEIKESSFQYPGIYNDYKLNWVSVLGSDQHHPTGELGQNFPGSHFTWIKMSTPNLDGLRLALLDGSLSIQRSDESTRTPNQHGNLVIESLTIQNATYMGCGDNLECHLNPWLNTIIGGRGTGKSSLLEFTRQIFRREKHLPVGLKKEFEKYCLVYRQRGDEGLLRDNTNLSAIYKKDGRRFTIQYSADGSTSSILEETVDGEWQQTQGDITSRFPIRIYSQKQIFELSKKPQALLQIIDDSPHVNFKNWDEKREQLENRYMSLCSKIREIESGVQDIPIIKGELDDVKTKLVVFEKARHAEILKEYQLRQRQRRMLDEWEQSWEDVETGLLSAAENCLPNEIEANLFKRELPENIELLNAIGESTETLDRIRKEVKELANEVSKERSKWAETRKSLKIATAISKSLEHYNQLKQQLSDAEIGHPEEYERLVKQRQELEMRIKELNSRIKAISDLKEQKDLCCKELLNHRRQLSQLRSDFLQTIIRENLDIRITIIPFKDRTAVEEEFRKLIGKENGFDRDIVLSDGNSGLLALLNADASMEDNIAKMKQSVLDIRSGTQTPSDKRFATHLKNLQPERFDRLMCWFPEDAIEVQYRPRPEMRLRPIKEGSPGQKNAALLAFLLSYGEAPLILDQPEDDLDNQLIYDLIVKQVRKKKCKRQIIIVTHNANIVVNGDSENVIVLDIQNGQSKIVSQGSLQKSTVREKICKVMEGGKEALDMRYKRIKAGSPLV